MKSQREIRIAFWDAHPQFKSQFKPQYKQNDYITDIRCAFVDYVDYLQKDGQITEKLARSVTL